MSKTKVLLFGAQGMLGGDLITATPDWIELSSCGRDKNIADLNVIKGLLSDHRPGWVINVAGYNNVDGAETEPEIAFAANAQGPKNLAEVCKKNSVNLIHVSTDYVFSGTKDTPYSEGDETSPLSVYAESKVKGEENVRDLPNHYILRTSSLYGMGRQNHASRALDSLKNGKHVNAATDLICHPTYTGDLARWIFDLVRKKPDFGTYHLCHTGSCTRYDFAETLCRIIGADPPFPLKKVLLGELQLPAKRPLNLSLSMEKWEQNVGSLLSWEEGLKNYLTALNLSVGKS